MAGNTFGNLFKLTTFGESHGEALGGILEGCPAGVSIDEKFIADELARRKPGQSAITTQRKEEDRVHFYSGIFEGKTTGTPIGFVIYNTNQKSKDYDHIKTVYRPSHADFTYDKKYGIRDYRGGGRSSARETACRVVGGAIAKLYLKNISFFAYTTQVGPIQLNESDGLNRAEREKNPVRVPHAQKAMEMERLIKKIRKEGDTIGGVVACEIKGLPAGLGEPVFDKLHAQLGKAMLSINAVKGFEIGSGFAAANMRGSEHNDLFNKDMSTQTNFSGGVQGGISNGMPIHFKVAFKPVATLMQKQNTVDTSQKAVVMQGKGRHDPCVVPRAVPIVEAMAALVVADFDLLQKRFTK
jgi:chorismate synthase